MRYLHSAWNQNKLELFFYCLLAIPGWELCWCLGGSGPLPATVWATTIILHACGAQMNGGWPALWVGRKRFARQQGPNFHGKKSILNLTSGSRNNLVRKCFLKVNFSQRAIQESSVPESAGIFHPSVSAALRCVISHKLWMSWDESSIFHFDIYNSTEMQVWQSKCPLRKKEKKKEICSRAFPGYIHTDELRPHPQRVHNIKVGPGECFRLTANSAISTQLPKLLEGSEETNTALSPCQVKNCCLEFHLPQ